MINCKTARPTSLVHYCYSLKGEVREELQVLSEGGREPALMTRQEF